MKTSKFNLSEMLKKAHTKTRLNRLSGWGKDKSYREVYAYFLSEVWKDAKEKMQSVELFVVKLNYNETKWRGWIKGLGFTWNPASKVWTGQAKKSQLSFLPESRINTKTSSSRRWIPANHATPGHFAYASGNYTQDVLSGYYEE